jgi:quinolinate synthase
MAVQAELPQTYRDVSTDELLNRIFDRKRKFGGGLCILAHHYQRDEIVRFADFTGDSLKLSQLAASQRQARHIIFCGVHFMAESADILSGDDQVVILPDFRAGCMMADMADDAAVESALQEIRAMTEEKVVPIAYVNSTGAVKAVTARAGGACCTSSNARNVFEWALRPASKGGAGAKKVLALPDQHLAHNTALAMGFAPGACVVYRPGLPNGGLTPEQMRQAAFILWEGSCYVHQVFQPEDVRRVRARHDGIRVLVHPECTHEVVSLSDAAGSTEQIIRAVEASAPGTQWAIGTESNLVNRLAKRHPDKFIRVLSDAPARCAQMSRIDLRHLLWALDNLAEGGVVNRVSVPAEIAADARIALKRMIDIREVKEVTAVPEVD